LKEKRIGLTFDEQVVDDGIGEIPLLRHNKIFLTVEVSLLIIHTKKKLVHEGQLEFVDS